MDGKPSYRGLNRFSLNSYCRLNPISALFGKVAQNNLIQTGLPASVSLKTNSF
jgi:hypothetical protein